MVKLLRRIDLIPSERAEPATASLFIVNPLAGGGSLLQLFSTHPSAVERVRGLRAMAQDMGSGRDGVTPREPHLAQRS